MEEIYFSPLRMTDLQKCLVDVVIELFKEKNISSWAFVSFREIENYLRDVNNNEAFPAEMLQEDLIYGWVGELIGGVFRDMVRWPVNSSNFNKSPLADRIKKINLILADNLWPRVELVDLNESQALISFSKGNSIPATILNSMALFLREVLRRELGQPELEILLES